MRRDALDRAIKTVHWKVPKYIYRRCSKCDDDVKGEQMWWFKYYYGGAYAHLGTVVWTCRRCAPMMSDLFEVHTRYFKDLDVSYLRAQEAAYNRQDKGSSNADV